MSKSRIEGFWQIGNPAIGCWRADGTIFDGNEALLRLLGVTREEINRGHVRWPDITPLEYAAHDSRALTEVQQHGEAIPYTKEYFRRDGRRIPVLVGGSLFDTAVREAGYFFAVDLTSVRVEHALYDWCCDSRQSAREIHHCYSRLTAREQEVAALLGRGETCKQIARRLGISHKTVDNHRATILDKMNADNPTQLAHMLAHLKPGDAPLNA